MTIKSALLAAREALLDLNACNNPNCTENNCSHALAKIDAALRELEAQEPVAYIEHHKGGDNLVWEPQKSSPRVTPLYAAPRDEAKDAERLAAVLRQLRIDHENECVDVPDPGDFYAALREHGLLDAARGGKHE